MSRSLPLTSRHVYVSGRVQGVAFRWYTQERAIDHGLAGWVRNLSDGRVEVRVEGAAEEVDAMVEWLRLGPPAARVQNVDVRERAPEGFTGFEIRRTEHGG